MDQAEIDETYERMTQSQRAALLMIALGQKWATEIMRLLRVDEIKQISYWINHMRFVPQEVTERVIQEFYERLAKKTSLASTGGRDYLIDVLSGMMGDQRARELAGDIMAQEENEVFRILKRVDPKQLAAYLKQEQPQTVALLMSYLDPTRAGAIIAELPEEQQSELIWRLARLEDADPDVVAAMERALNENLGGMAASKRGKKVGGPKAVAEILNCLPRDREKSLMEEISERDFDLAADIKDLMFVFADILLLDDKSIQEVIKEVDNSDLILALKGANDQVKEKIFRNVSKRQVDTINDELAFMGPVKSSTVNTAQQKIVNIIRKLDEEGRVLIQGKGGGGDDIIA
ncbi:MAG: flagellar motor switch protein FliG [Chlamydiia bacterium]|nr:flagellar motor switch protein FliG [Chlamydiia bacterium]